MWHRGLLAKLEQLGVAGDLLKLFSSYLQGRSLRVVVSGRISATYPNEASVPQGSILGPILWNIYFNDLLQSLPLASAYADDCTLSHSYNRDETANVIEDINRHLRVITDRDRGARWQVSARRSDKVWCGYPCHPGLSQHPGGGSRFQTLLRQPPGECGAESLSKGDTLASG